MKMWMLALFCLLPACSPEPEAVVIGEIPGISQPHSLLVTNNDLIFLDGFTAHVYSLDPLELKHSFAGQGEGDHQLQYWPRLGLQGEAIYGLDFLKTNLFSLEGELLRTVPNTTFDDFDPSMEMVIEPVGENYVRVTVDHELNRRYVQLYDSDFQLIRELYEGLFDWQGLLPAYRIDVAVDDEHIVVSDSEKGFFILIFDTQGNLLSTIDKPAEVEPIPITEAYQTAFLESARVNEAPWVYEQYSQNPNFMEHHPMINHVQIDGGRLYVTTNRRQGDKREMLILDLEGQILETLYLPLKSVNLSRRILRFDPYLVHNGTLYEMVRNDSTGEFELLATELHQH